MLISFYHKHIHLTFKYMGRAHRPLKQSLLYFFLNNKIVFSCILESFQLCSGITPGFLQRDHSSDVQGTIYNFGIEQGLTTYKASPLPSVIFFWPQICIYILKSCFEDRNIVHWKITFLAYVPGFHGKHYKNNIFILGCLLYFIKNSLCWI